MADASSEEDRPGDPPRWRDGLAETAWFLVAVALFLGGLVVAGPLTLGAAAIVLAGVALLALLMRRPEQVSGQRRSSAPSAPVWPDTSLKLFSEALPDPAFILDTRGIVRYANQRAIETFGVKAGNPLTSRLRVPDVIAAFERISRGGRPERVEFVERVPTERWFTGWFAPLDPGGRGGHFIAFILDDMTERRRAERIRVDFVANASHELRTPLASLAGFVETLQGPAKDDAVARERFLRIMQEQAMRMARLVDDLLSLSRIELKAHLRPSGSVDLGATIRHVADALEPLGRELGVTIETSIPAAPVPVAGDRDELIQVFENLIENACKYGRTGGRVVVSLTADGASGPTVTVRDFGPGIAEEHIPRLTERFYRVEAEESRKHRGTGLGLAIVKHIVQRHQARLTIESQLGEGSTFRIAFPQPPIA